MIEIQRPVVISRFYCLYPKLVDQFQIEVAYPTPYDSSRCIALIRHHSTVYRFIAHRQYDVISAGVGTSIGVHQTGLCPCVRLQPYATTLSITI